MELEGTTYVIAVSVSYLLDWSHPSGRYNNVLKMMRDIGEIEEKEVEEEVPSDGTNKAALGVAIALAVVFTVVCGTMIGVLHLAGIYTLLFRPI